MTRTDHRSSRRVALIGLVGLASLALATVSLHPAASAQRRGAAGLRIDHPWTRPIPPGAPVAGGYLTIVNAGTKADRLLAVSSPHAGRVELHRMSMDGGVMRMRPIPEGLDIPAGSSVSLAPGGYHLMIFGPKQGLKLGDRLPVVLRFAKAGEVKADLVTEDPASNGGKP